MQRQNNNSGENATFNASRFPISRTVTVYGFLLLLLAITVVFSIRFGAVQFSWDEITDILFAPGNNGVKGIIWREIRLPRLLLGLLAGAALAGSGVILQSVLHNDLASAEIIGVTAGGGTAGLLILLLFPQYLSWLTPTSFAGALLCTLAVYLISCRNGANPVKLVLAGVAVSALLGAIGSIMLILNPHRAVNAVNFAVGSLSGRGWAELKAVWPYTIPALFLVWFYAKKLDLLALGDDFAAGLGINPERTRLVFLMLAALLAAGAVSSAGLLGFVGLMAPHICRKLAGNRHAVLLPASAICGAWLLTLADTLGRMLRPPMEVPAGIPLAIAGSVFFLSLLLRRTQL